MIMAYDDSNAVIVPTPRNMDTAFEDGKFEYDEPKQDNVIDAEYKVLDDDSQSEPKKEKWGRLKKFGKKSAEVGKKVGEKSAKVGKKVGSATVKAGKKVGKATVKVASATNKAMDKVVDEINKSQKQSEKPVEAEEPIQTTPKTSKSRNQSGKRKSQSKQTVHTEDVDLDEYLKDWQTEEKYDPVAEKNARENVLKLRKMMDNDDLDFDPEELEYYETELKKQIILKRKIKGPVKSQPKQSRPTQTTPKKKKSVKSSGKRTTATKKKSATTKRKTAKKKTQSAPKKKVEKDPYDGLDWL